MNANCIAEALIITIIIVVKLEYLSHFYVLYTIEL